MASTFCRMTRGGAGAAFYQQHVLRGPGQRLQADRARSRVQIEHPCPVQRPHDGGDSGKQPLQAAPGARRPCLASLRDHEPTATRFASDSRCHPLRAIRKGWVFFFFFFFFFWLS